MSNGPYTDKGLALVLSAIDTASKEADVSAPVASKSVTFLDWWTSQSHRAKYHPEHPVTLAAREAWDAASCQSVAPVGVVDRIMPNGFRWLERHATLPPDGTKLYSLAEIVGEAAAASAPSESWIQEAMLLAEGLSAEDWKNRTKAYATLEAHLRKQKGNA